MQSLLIIVLQACLVITCLHTSVGYQYPDSYKVTDDVEDYEDAPQSPPPEEQQPSKVDYTKYFGGSVSPIASPSALHPSSDSFVHSLDFPPFFGGGFSSLDTMPASSPLVAGGIYGLSSSPVRYGAPLQSTAGINASASTSQAGFVDPNPYSAFRSLFGGSPLQAAVPVYPSYQYLPQQPSTYIPVQPSTYAQPSASYSLYLPNYQRVKDSVTRNVQKDQRQLSQSTMQKAQDAKRPKKKDDIDEFYDKSKSVEDEEDEEEESGEEDDDEGYSFEEVDEKSKKSSKPESKTESPLGKSSYPLKGGSYSSSYSDKPKRISKSESRSNSRQQTPTSSPSYSGAYDYPKVGLDDLKSDYNYDYNWFPSPTNSKEKEPVRAQSGNRPVSGYRPPASPSLSNAHRSNSPAPLSSPNTRQSHSHSSKQPSYQANGYINSNVPAYTHGTPTKYSRGFVPSANIPHTDGFPKANKKQYRSSYATAPSELSQVRSKEAYSGESINDKRKCIKIEKNITSDPSKTYGGYPMTCYKCHDEATGASSESCSYDTEKSRKSYQEVDPQTIKVEKSVKGPHSIRAKRESPYDLSFSQDTNIGESVTLVRKVRQYAEYDDTSDYDGDGTSSDEANYRFGPEYFKGGSDESTQSSEYVPETEIGEDCTKVTKNGVTCMVCEKETGGTYEQCSYASDPNANSYSYGSSSRYGHGSSSDKQPRQNNNNRNNNNRNNNNNQNNRRNQGRNKQSRRNRRFTDLHTSNNMKREVKLVRRVRQSPKPHNAARKKTKATSKVKGNDARAKHNSDDDDDSYEIPDDFAESVSRIRKADNGIVGLDPFFYGSPEDTYASEEKKEKKAKNNNDDDDDGDSEEDEETSTASSNGNPTYEDYFYRLFPELTEKGNSKNKKPTANSDYDDSAIIEDGEESESQQPSKTLVPGFDFQSSFPDYFEEKEQNEDLEKVLGEFSQKDRSACKKVMKDKMTCYQCVDEKGMQHEECMFVAATEPKSKHLAYHEVKQFNLSPNEKSEKTPVVTNKLANTKPLIFHPNAKQDPNDGLDMDNQETLKLKRRIPVVDSPTFVNDGEGQEDDEEEEDDEGDEEEVIENDNSPQNLTESAEIQATENVDIIKLPPKPSTGGPISKVMIHNQRYFQSTGSSSPEAETETEKQVPDQLQRKKRLSPPQNDALMSAVNAYNRRDQRGQNSEENERTEEDEYDEEGDEDSNEDPPKQNKEERAPKKRKNYNPIPTDPPAFEVPEGPEGAYSTDTEPAYDTTLRITLPRYMLSRSEHEAVFDEVLASG
ncbi:probable serine/threonine-protein kinase DDB_G0278845 [Nilaparvata lugens]|uniref:probable serine/threonine-protein kinase DDB_G0278845 n=1 Tax=Nilaparvata lugens TaxID=108931 RepID=UPI00193CD42A|nr:probable serine/threonine-protein kinase DDB_G0278845 [Nilaparvata lugens]